MLANNWQNLIKPTKLDITPTAHNANIATVIAEPLERGFGHTLGVALRRILLSSLQGAAITSMKIDGVLHEFSAIPGVREDVTEIVLNVKDIRIKASSGDKKRLHLAATGPCEVTAGMIECPGDIEILNKTQTLCTLDKGAKLNIEFTVETGKGYVRATKSSDAPILVNTLSTTPIRASLAGTKQPIWAIITIRATCLMYVDLPAILGPVSIII